jgi:hypothetical protein
MVECAVTALLMIVSEAVPSPKLTNCNNMEIRSGNKDDMSATANLRTETSFARHNY